MKSPETRMAVLTIALVLGILTAEYIPMPVGFIVLLALFTAIIILKKACSFSDAFVVLLIFTLGAFKYTMDSRLSPLDASYFTEQVYAFNAVVISDPEIRNGLLNARCKIEKGLIKGKWVHLDGNALVNINLSSFKKQPRLNYGDNITARVKLSLPEDPTNPAQFSWKTYLNRQGITATAWVERPDQLSIHSNASQNLFMKAAFSVRHYISSAISKNHSSIESAFTIGMVLGTYSYLPADIYNNFTRTGTLHLLAASGYNCFLIMFVAYFLLNQFNIQRKYKAVIVICIIFAYLLVVGFKPSLVRATIMASLALLAIPLKRVPNVTNLFFCAAFIVLLITPQDLFDIGFQLSFMGVYALIAVAPVLDVILNKSRKKPAINKRQSFVRQHIKSALEFLSATIVATVSVTLVTAPIVAYYFNYISLVSLAGNIVMALGVPLVFADGILCSALAQIPLLSSSVGFVGSKIASLMISFINFLGGLRYSAVSVQSPNIILIIAYYLFLFIVLNIVRNRIEKN